ncbi:hypothetical protein LPB142_13905 [Rhodobacter xanthinilyticus]|uniref:Phosphatidic acid phosphatase type 2/haloperoxidase domain-containing protein n=1 Tax=Rhodobacter xanthinilyticus TaxID=1850250 RepID=A0A1D9MEI5_9RHOB|nr:phosphatase PAP2 family protein [Rhodobacter xanthinilyticus]AOZ70281.1 hypothetical protein LPB142_13905 [Rhodobacter xanthinilyticus]
MPQIDLTMTGRWLLAGWLGAVALFLGAPSVDLAISGLFWDQGWALSDRWVWEFLRQRVWDVSILLFLASPFALWRALARRRAVLGLPARAWGFLFTLYLLVPGLLVNGYLKAHSGRARPGDVAEFGGAHLFSPAGTFTDQCARNCSFVSGEVSAATVLGVALWLWASLARSLEGWQRVYLRVLGVAVVVFTAVQRVMTGRHFPSDAVFAALITLTAAWALAAVFSGQAGRALAARRG